MKMKIYSVFDDAFKLYGRVITGHDAETCVLVEALKDTPMPEAVCYAPADPMLEAVPEAQRLAKSLYGGQSVQIGWCNGHNTRLNCLEYHRDSEFNLGADDFILLLAKQDEIEDWTLDTAKVKAFKVPAGVLVECYSTTLHYAPCNPSKNKGFRVIVALPKGTNGPAPAFERASGEDRLLWACNKWLLAHADSDEAAQGAFVGLKGENLDIAEII